MTVYYFVFDVYGAQTSHKVESFPSVAAAKKRFTEVKKEVAAESDVDPDERYWCDSFEAPFEQYLRKAVVNTTADLINLLNNLM